MVWPSNELLCRRTGLAERTIRLAARQLITAGIIRSHDSPNGKRFAQRARNGDIVKAYGFDLSPLFERLQEFRNLAAELEETERRRREIQDEITIHRRASNEALRAMERWFPETAIGDLQERFETLVRQTPRRGAGGALEPVQKAWIDLRMECEERYNTAYGGKNYRHKDRNKDAPTYSLSSASSEEVAPKPPSVTVSVRDVADACPDAMEFTGLIRSPRELVDAVSRLRGAFGVHQSAWLEACEEIGPMWAAITLLYVVQLQARPAPDAPPIRNAGGYFRAIVRLMAAGRFNLSKEITKLKGKNLCPPS